jgi:hypothetical protein
MQRFRRVGGSRWRTDAKMELLELMEKEPRVTRVTHYATRVTERKEVVQLYH